MTPPAWFTRLLAAADVPVAPARVWRAGQAAVVGAALCGAAAGGLPLALLAAGVALAGPLVALRASGGRADARYEAALPGALEAVARALRSGASPGQALAEAATATPGAVGSDLDRVARAARRGVPLVDALARWAAARPLPAVRLAVAALCLGVETGGPQARAVDGVAATLRDRLAVAGERRALTTQARASAAVVTLAPLAFGILAGAADPRTVTFLLRTGPGLACLAGGLLLDGLAALWTARLTRPRP